MCLASHGAASSTGDCNVLFVSKVMCWCTVEMGPAWFNMGLYLSLMCAINDDEVWVGVTSAHIEWQRRK
ncbi:hypothetical protein PanWU01x14_270370 [Parasponia andersonii]|uniref:Uncharacterized protein n=1 Tax=Parasponia andersonii TaxID=3476 RepID=A0A2P5B543_PARAD|nr:hypothetical protein PanWU01x14_270370 [Parasponia andersonii]